MAEIEATEGVSGVARYWAPFSAHAVERILSDYPNGIIDFGGGHSVYDDTTLFERVARALRRRWHL